MVHVNVGTRQHDLNDAMNASRKERRRDPRGGALADQPRRVARARARGYIHWGQEMYGPGRRWCAKWSSGTTSCARRAPRPPMSWRVREVRRGPRRAGRSIWCCRASRHRHQSPSRRSCTHGTGRTPSPTLWRSGAAQGRMDRERQSPLDHRGRFRHRRARRERPRVARRTRRNGRWAKEKGEDRLFGHYSGVESVRNIVEGCAELGIEYLTLYAFSTENWDRPRDEVTGLMELLVQTIKQEVATLNKNNIRLHVIGNIKNVACSGKKRT